ncbi:hypothetical protein Peur_055398 [Populus x canadensis]
MISHLLLDLNLAKLNFTDDAWDSCVVVWTSHVPWLLLISTKSAVPITVELIGKFTYRSLEVDASKGSVSFSSSLWTVHHSCKKTMKPS